MGEVMQLAVVAFKYIAALVITLMAFKAAYERSKGGDLKSLIVGFLTFVGVFWAFIVLFPVLFNIGFSKVYTQVEASPHVANMTQLAGAGLNLVMANPQAVELNIPQVDAATELGNVLSLPAVTTGSAPAASNPAPVVKPGNGEPAPVKVVPPANSASTLGPSNPTQFHPEPHYLEKPAVTGSVELIPRNLSADEVQGLPNYSNPNLIGPGVTKDGNGGGGPTTHTVRSGDSLAKIARAHGVSVSDLCNANYSVVRGNCNLLRTGMVLSIP